MKLTPKLKSQIDKMSPHQICSMFRFHPTNITSGESGKYMQDAVRNIAEKEREELEQSRIRKVFGITRNSGES